MVEIRRLQPGELREADLLWLQCFERGRIGALDDLPEGRVGFENRMVRFGLWDAAGMQAAFQMYACRVRFGPATVLPATYISSIACAPAARGRGYGAAGLRHMLEDMRDAGQVLTRHSPFHHDYYRQLGWEWIMVSRTYQVPSRHLVAGPETEHVRSATEADRPNIHAMYERFSARYRGMSVREGADWDLILDGKKSYVSYVYLYENEEEGIEGYLVLRAGDAEKTYLPEFLAVSARAQRGLLGLLRRMHAQSKTFTWDAPEDDGLWTQFMHRETRTELSPSLMGRVVDVPAALHALKPAPFLRGEFTLSIRDTFAPWNEGTWSVVFDKGELTATVTKQAPDVCMDIRAFTQAFCGTLPVTTLRNRERVEVAREPGFSALQTLFDGPPEWSNGPL